MLVIILGSTLCVVCMWHFLVLTTEVCACDNSWLYSYVVCMWHFLVLLTVVCACDNSSFYSLCCVHVAFLGSTHCGLCL